jgi:heat shock protein HslJ
MARSFRLIGVSLLLGVLAACAHHPIDRSVQLRGTAWQLDVLGDRPAMSPRPMLRFDLNGNISGQASCNRYAASARIAGDTITIGPISATRMSCGDAIDAQESAYLGRLGKATRFEVDGTILKIYSGTESAPLQFLSTPEG